MNCDRIASLYIRLEHLVFGQALEKCRFTHLNMLEDCRHALLLGDGDGRFLEAFLRANPNAVVDTVDRSGEMLSLARQRVAAVPGALQRVQFVQVDARQFRGRTAYDVVVAHFFLDCLTEPEIHSLMERITVPLWIISEFRIPQHGYARPVAIVLIRLMYAFFGVVTGLKVQRLPDYPAVLRQKGFVLSKSVHGLGGLLTAEVWKNKNPQ